MDEEIVQSCLRLGMVRQATVMRFGPTSIQGVIYGPSTSEPIISLCQNILAYLCPEDLRVLNDKILHFVLTIYRCPSMNTTCRHCQVAVLNH